MNSRSLRLYAASTDEELLAALRADDRGAYAEIFRRYSARLFEMASRKLKSREIAEDLVQELFEKLWFRRAENPAQQLEQYLFSAIKYRIINHMRACGVREGYAAYCRLSQTEAVAVTEEALAVDDVKGALLNGMQKLPEQTREIFRLSRLEQFTVPEIALQVNLSAKTVESHLTRSLKVLRVHLKDFLVLVVLALLQ
jgi:RNA polymerase sigma-70 factor (family 1)